MRKILVLLLALALLMACAGCFCGHSWVEADCLNARSCPLCGRVEGKPLGHRWQEVTCLAPKTCAGCGETEGEAVDHSWQDASCAAPRNCKWCGLTQGQALDHTWQEATTEAPRTCLACGATEGSRIITDERFTTAANRDLFGTWETERTLTGEELNLGSYMEAVDVVLTVTFGEDGTLEIVAGFRDVEAFAEELVRNTVEILYSQFEAMDIGREEADVMLEDAYGMNVHAYAEHVWSGTDYDALVGRYSGSRVYYVEDGNVNMAANWEGTFRPSTYTLAGDRLTLVDPDGITMELTRVE